MKTAGNNRGAKKFFFGTSFISSIEFKAALGQYESMVVKLSKRS
jgi:hypothetical protein